MRNVSTKNKMTLCHGLMEYQQFDFMDEKMDFDTLWSPIFQGVNDKEVESAWFDGSFM